MTRHAKIVLSLSAVLFGIVSVGATLAILAARLQFEFFWVLNWFFAGASFLLFAAAFGCFILADVFRKRFYWSASTLASAVAIWLALVVSWWVLDAQVRGNERRGNLIVDAVIRYRAATGRYPATLEDLTPVYLSRVPTCWYGLWRHEFWYRNDSGQHFLKFNDVPCVSGRFDSFDGRGWESQAL